MTDTNKYKYKPRGVKKAVELLNQAIDGKIKVYFDPDPDGLYAGYFAVQFLKQFNKHFDYYINENREHGFRLPITDALKDWTIIAVDFTITVEEMQKLEEVGARVINIDHHEIAEKELFTTEHGVIINNQYCFEPERWRFLSGAGMVYALFSNILPSFDCADTRAVVGLSLLSDVRVLESEEAQYFLSETYKNRSDLFKYLIQITQNEKDFTFGDIFIDRTYADFVLHPKLNALFRLNMGMEAIHLLLRDDDTISVNLNTLKEQQNIITGNILKNIDRTEHTGLNIDKVDSSIMPDGIYRFKLTNFTGLACSKSRDDGKTTFLYIKDVKTGECIRGSVRGKYDTVDYLALFRKYGVNCAGHHNAFGVISCDMANIDFEALSREIEEQEQLCQEKEYKNRIMSTSNMSVFIAMKNQEIAKYNIYVRDSKRIFIKYTGNNWAKEQKGRMWEIKVDGVVIKCFDAELTPENAYILPILERGYIQYYLKKLA